MLSVYLQRRFGDFVLNVGFESDARTLVIIGPSGAGKSALLKMIAGISKPDGGRIELDGDALFGDGANMPPDARRMGYVPQDFALFPHLTVEQNIAFGLKGLGRGERAERVKEMLALTDLEAQKELRPRALSGGQKQRTALGRALAVRPRMLLLDEPFASLDAPTRLALLDEVQGIIARSGTPTVFVTHDRSEALRLGDHIVVLMDGRVRQSGSPSEVFGAPADEEVAQFVGVETIAPGLVREVRDGVALLEVAGHTVEGGSGVEAGDDVLFCLRPEDVVISRAHSEAAATSARNRLAARVTQVVPWGPFVRVTMDAGFQLVSFVTKQAVEELELAPDAEVVATFKATAVHLIRRPGPTPEGT